MKYISLLICVFYVSKVPAQTDTISLEATRLLGKSMMDKTLHSSLTISDSLIKKSQPSLTQLLLFSSPLYFKESGSGMVSSASFRGTTPSQTIVLWNGIPINSQTTGQTDFNTVSIYGYDKIVVKGGGGNVAYNNSSVGGSIDLIDENRFNKGFSQELNLRYGSFNTFSGNSISHFSNETTSIKIGVSRNSSDNDYEIEKKGELLTQNINGQFYQNNFSVSTAYQINSKNKLEFISHIFNSRRNLSVISPYATRQKYEDYTTRSLVSWKSHWRNFTSDLKTAYLTEAYRFYRNANQNTHQMAEVNTLLSRYQLGYTLSSTFQMKAQLEFLHNDGSIDEAKDRHTRNSGSMSLTANHQLSSDFNYTASIRQEISEMFGNPLLYSLGGNWEINGFYTLRFNGSKNFRMPTYNDLYWPEVGNPTIQPEISYQGEVGNDFNVKNLKISLTGYYNSIENLIRWLPNSNPLGGVLWAPENVEKVRMYGLESIFSFSKSLNHHQLSVNGTYAFTISEDLSLKKQLSYVPLHKVTTSLAYGWKNLTLYGQFLYNGKVYTTPENDVDHELAHYYITNLGLDYDFGKTETFRLGFEVLNLTNYQYVSMESRPMPGRHFQLYINIKI